MGTVSQIVVVVAESCGEIGVVEAEGNLAAVIYAVHRDALQEGLGVKLILFQNSRNVFLAQGDLAGIGGRLGEDGVFQIQAGIDDGYQHPLAPIAQIPSCGGAHAGAHILHGGGDFSRRGLHVRHGEGRHQVSFLHTGHILQGGKIAVGNRGGDGVHHQGEIFLHLDAVAQLFLHGTGVLLLGSHNLLHGGQLLLPQLCAYLNRHGFHPGNGLVLKYN